MVLVDTSSWIRYLRGQAPYTEELDKLLENHQVASHDLVYGELLMGDLGGRKNLLKLYERIDRAPFVAHHEVVLFVCERKLHGLGLGWIDAQLLASAIVGRLKLWTADKAVAEAAKRFGVDYQVSGESGLAAF